MGTPLGFKAAPWRSKRMAPPPAVRPLAAGQAGRRSGQGVNSASEARRCRPRSADARVKVGQQEVRLARSTPALAGVAPKAPRPATAWLWPRPPGWRQSSLER